MTMKKNIIKYAAILLSFASILTVFTACSSGDDGSLLFEDKGKIYYRQDENDAAYELVTDANGVTVVDEQGNLLWKVTDAEGNDQTHPVSFPAYLEDGKEISCQQFTITVPKGWKNIGNFKIMLKNPDEGLQIDYSFFEPDEGEDVISAAEQVEQFKKLFSAGIEDGTTVITESQTQIGGRDAVKIVLENTGDSPAYMEIYYVELATGLMSFNCSCKYENKGEFDFKAVLDTIEYRI